MSSEFMGESCGVAQKEAYLREICRVDDGEVIEVR